MGYERFKKPVRATVWFHRGHRVDGRVFGVEDGFAVADVAEKDLEKLFGSAADIDDDEAGWVTVRSYRGVDRLRVARGRVYLGFSWPLFYEVATADR